MVDHRRHPRISSLIETLYYTESATQQGSERMYLPGIIIDKSHGGLGLLVKNEHNLDESIWLEGIKRSPQPIEAKVRWVSNNSPTADEFKIGVEFIA